MREQLSSELNRHRERVSEVESEDDAIWTDALSRIRAAKLAVYIELASKASNRFVLRGWWREAKWLLLHAGKLSL